MTQEALKLALEALTYIYTETTADEDELIHAAITAIKETLAQPAPPHDRFDEIAANVFNNAFNKGQGRHSAFKEITEKVKEMPWENDTKDSFIVWLKEQA